MFESVENHELKYGHFLAPKILMIVEQRNLQPLYFRFKRQIPSEMASVDDFKEGCSFRIIFKLRYNANKLHSNSLKP